MFEEAHHFSIRGGQFIYNNYGNQPVQNPTITYEQIKLATPSAPAIFTGRDSLVAEATQELCKNRSTHLAILGAAGMGKTALALHITKEEMVEAKFKTRIYFAPCELCTEAPGIIQILLQTLELSVPKGMSGYKVLDSFLGSSPAPILLVLDNFETPWNLASDQLAVQNLIEHFWGHKNLSIIITMRGADGPGNRKWIKLGGDSGLPPLQLEKAREAFMLISNSEKEDIKLLDWLLNELDCIPLAILLISQIRKRQLDLQAIADSWKKHKTRMLKTGSGKNRLTSLSLSIDLSLQILESLNAQSVEMLPILSFLPNGIPSWKEELHKLIPGMEIAAIVALFDTALMYQAKKTLKMLNPIREHIQAKFPANEEHLNQMGNFYGTFLINVGLNNQVVVEPHIVNITKVFQLQLQSADKKKYLAACYLLFSYTTFFPITMPLIDIALMQEWEEEREEKTELRFEKQYMLYWLGQVRDGKEELEKIQLMWTSQPKLSDGKKVGQIAESGAVNDTDHEKQKIDAKCMQKMGDFAEMESNYTEAERMFAEARAAFERIGDQLGVAQCLQRMCNVAQMDAKYSEAERMIAEAKAAFERIGDQQGAAQCLQSMGDIAHRESKYTKAERMFAEAKTAFERIGDKVGAAQCLQSMGNIALMEDNYSDAETMLVEAKATFERIGDQLGPAQCLQSMANLAQIKDKYSEAERMLAEAKATFLRIGNQLGAAQCLRSMGNIARMEHKCSEARIMVAEAKAAFEGIGSPLGAAQCLQSMGHIARMEHKYAEGGRLFAEAKATFERIGDQLGAAQCLQGIGDVALMEDKYSEAETMLTEAKAAFESIGDQRGVAECLRSMGDIATMEHKYPEAKKIVAEAKAAFGRIGDHLGAAQCLQIMGNIAQMEDRYSDAETMLAEAKAAFERIGDQLGAAQCLLSMGNIAQNEYEYSEAEEMLAKAKAAFERIGDQLGVALCLKSMGDIAEVENKYPEAERMLAEAKVAFEKIGSQLRAAQCSLSMGLIAQRRHKYSEAKAMLAEAKATFDTIGDQQGAAFCLQVMANITQLENKASHSNQRSGSTPDSF